MRNSRRREDMCHTGHVTHILTSIATTAVRIKFMLKGKILFQQSNIPCHDVNVKNLNYVVFIILFIFTLQF
jgi:hypothetical protein